MGDDDVNVVVTDDELVVVVVTEDDIVTGTDFGGTVPNTAGDGDSSARCTVRHRRKIVNRSIMLPRMSLNHDVFADAPVGSQRSVTLLTRVCFYESVNNSQ